MYVAAGINIQNGEKCAHANLFLFRNFHAGLGFLRPKKYQKVPLKIKKYENHSKNSKTHCENALDKK